MQVNHFLTTHRKHTRDNISLSIVFTGIEVDLQCLAISIATV